MPMRWHLRGYGKLAIFPSAAVRLGIYTGACLSLVFVAWLLVANRVPILDRFALERNVAAAAAIGFFVLIPVVRFRGAPGRLWASGAIAWGILSLSYWLLTFFFSGLAERYSAFQIFMVGAVVYTMIATICWVATVLWRMRSHSHASPSNHHMT
jgi:hypothetical protein